MEEAQLSEAEENQTAFVERAFFMRISCFNARSLKTMGFPVGWESPRAHSLPAECAHVNWTAVSIIPARGEAELGSSPSSDFNLYREEGLSCQGLGFLEVTCHSSCLSFVGSSAWRDVFFSR